MRAKVLVFGMLGLLMSACGSPQVDMRDELSNEKIKEIEQSMEEQAKRNEQMRQIHEQLTTMQRKRSSE